MTEYTHDPMPQPVVKPQDVPEYWDAPKHQNMQALTVPCPHCKAIPGERCIRNSAFPPYRASTQLAHPSRYEHAGLEDPRALRIALAQEQHRRS